jgi:hypothetical protein
MSSYATLCELKNKIQIEKDWSITIYTHPNNLRFLKDLPLKPSDDYAFSAKGIPVHTDENLAETVKVWKMPPAANRFYEYSEADIVWAKPIGYGYEVPEPLFYIMQKPRFFGFNPLYPGKNIAKLH